MADKFTGDRHLDVVRSHDEGDGSFSESIAAHNRGWDATDGAWNRLPVDHATGALKVYTSGSGVAGGGAATIADGADVAEGLTTDAAVVSDVAGTVSGKLRGLVKWAFERMPASLGQKAMTASLAVVLASDQASVPVAATLSAETTKVIGTVNPPALTKGTQGANGWTNQQLHDAGRNVTNYFHAAPIITTTAEVMQTLTGYKGGIAVGATATPAVVTAAKTYRITRVTISYTAATVIGGALVRLRANLSGVGVVGSPLVCDWYVGNDTAFVAGTTDTFVFPYPEGLEFAAGTGIAVGVIGGGAVPTTGTATGYVLVSIEGYEY